MIYRILILFFCLPLLTGCGVYSFTGASAPEGLKSIKVFIFENEAQFNEPNLDNELTELVKSRLRSTFGFRIEQDEDAAQAFLSATITGYDITSIGATAEEISNKKQLKITLKVKFYNKIDPNLNYEGTVTKDKSFEGEYEDNKASFLDQLKGEVVDEIINQIFGRW